MSEPQTQVLETVTPAQREAVTGAAKTRVQLFTSLEALFTGGVAGGLTGAMFTGFSEVKTWGKTITGAAIGAVTGLVIANLTWVMRPKPVKEEKFPESAVLTVRDEPTEPTHQSKHAARLEHERAEAELSATERTV